MSIFYFILFLIKCEAHIYPPMDAPFTFGVESSYMTTTQNYFGDGSVQNIFSFGTLSFLDSEVYGSLRIRSVNIFASVRHDYGTLKVLTETNTQSQISEGQLGVNYRLGTWVVDPSVYLSAVIPFQTFSTANLNRMFLGDGAFAFRAGMFLKKTFKLFLTESYIGGNYRTQGLSSLGEWKVGGGLHYGIANLMIGGEGAVSLTQDNDSDTNLTRISYLNYTNGGSYMFDSVNPTVTNLFAQIGAEIAGSVRVGLGYRLPIAGYRYAKASSVFLTLAVYPSFGSGSDENFRYEDEVPSGDGDFVPEQ